MNNLLTGYFADIKHCTKVHLVSSNKALCGYEPGNTMQFQWCGKDAITNYVECKKCKENLATYFEIITDDKNWCKFYNSPFSISIKDVIKDAEKREFNTSSEAIEWGKKCARYYRKFMKNVTYYRSETIDVDDAVKSTMDEIKNLRDSVSCFVKDHEVSMKNLEMKIVDTLAGKMPTDKLQRTVIIKHKAKR